MLSWWLPETLATYTGRDGGLLPLVYWTTGIAFVLGQMVTLRAAARSRVAAPASRDGLALEAIWAIVPALMLIGLGLLATLARKAA